MILKKRLISILTALACMISMLCVFGQITTYSSRVNTISALSGLSATDITSQMTIGWNLGNSLEAHGDGYTIDTEPKKFATYWGNPEPTQELFETIKNAGFNTVRIPVTWYQHLDSNNQIDSTWLAYVKKTVDYAYNQGMFVILNIHHEDFINVSTFSDDTLSTAKTKMTAIWSQLADTFANYDQHLIFEGMNEPRQTLYDGSTNQAPDDQISEWGNGASADGSKNAWGYIDELNATFISTVRANTNGYNSQRLLMIPSYCATSDSTALKNLTIPDNSGNVAISVHAYSPYFFAMGTDSYSNHTYPGKDGYGNDYSTQLDDLFNNLKSISYSKNVPIIIGEFSASDFDNTTSRVNWATDYLTKAKSVNIPCVLWDNNVIYDESNPNNGEAHGYIYRATNTFYPNSLSVVQAMMNTLGISGTFPEYKELTFSWDTVNIGTDWIELYKSESGSVLENWEDNLNTNADVSNYLNENYNLAVVYKSEDVNTPTLVLPKNYDDYAWLQVSSSDLENFIAYYSYEDITSVLNGVSSSQLKTAVLIGSPNTTIYGLYAVPRNSTTEKSEISIYGMSILLDGTIGVKFYINMNDVAYNDTNTSIKVSYLGNTVDTLNPSQLTKESSTSDTMYSYTYYVPAKEMCNDITLNVVSTDVSDTKTTSVKTYSETILNGNYTDDTKSVVNAMLNYGGYAQKIFNYNTDNLASSILTIDYSTQMSAPLDEFSSYSCNIQTNEEIKYHSMSLILENETTIRIYFTIPSTSSLDCSQVKLLNQTTNEQYDLIAKNDYYYVDISNIPANLLSTSYNYTLIDGSRSIGSIENLSAMTYCYKVMNSTSTSDDLKNVAQAIRIYSNTAKSYNG